MAKIRRHLFGLILCFHLDSLALAQTPTTAIIGTPPQPGWSLLSTQQKIILAPLAKEWDNMENIRRKKWLGIAERYPTLSKEVQGRIQQRMQEWAALNPAQRAKVRDSYKEFNQLTPEKKQALKQKWKTYSNLTEDEKKQVKQTGKLPTAQPAQASESESSPRESSTVTSEPAKP